MKYDEIVNEIVWPNPHVAKLFLDEVKLLKGHNLTEGSLASRFEVSILRFRALNATANKSWWTYLKEKALKMEEEGYSRPKIAMDLGISESTIRRFFDTNEEFSEAEEGG